MSFLPRVEREGQCHSNVWCWRYVSLTSPCTPLASLCTSGSLGYSRGNISAFCLKEKKWMSRRNAVWRIKLLFYGFGSDIYRNLLTTVQNVKLHIVLSQTSSHVLGSWSLNPPLTAAVLTNYQLHSSWDRDILFHCNIAPCTLTQRIVGQNSQKSMIAYLRQDILVFLAYIMKWDMCQRFILSTGTIRSFALLVSEASWIVVSIQPKEGISVTSDAVNVKSTIL